MSPKKLYSALVPDMTVFLTSLKICFKSIDKSAFLCYNIFENDLGVAQVVARYLGVVEAVGSSPVTQTM